MFCSGRRLACFSPNPKEPSWPEEGVSWSSKFGVLPLRTANCRNACATTEDETILTGDEDLDEKDEEEDGVRLEVVNVKSGAREVNVSGARDIPLSETQRPSLHEGSKLIVQATNATTNQSTAYGTNGSTANRSTISRIGGGDIAAGSNI